MEISWKLHKNYIKIERTHFCNLYIVSVAPTPLEPYTQVVHMSKRVGFLLICIDCFKR
jgi:hypothetical protein